MDIDLEAKPLVPSRKCPEGTGKDSLKKDGDVALSWAERCSGYLTPAQKCMGADLVTICDSSLDVLGEST
jgi:hypothetical protein